MKKVLIVSHAMEIGGAERALIEMLNCFDYDNFDVDLFLYRHQGDWLNEIPSKVNLLPEISQYSCLAVPMGTVIKKMHLGVAFGRVFGKYLANLYAKTHNHKETIVPIEYSHKYTKFFLPNINYSVEYDLVISFLTPHYVATEKVRAKKRIAWIHTDYSKLDVNVKSELKMWAKYDYIVSISDECTKGFLTKFPQLRDKIIKVENCLSSKVIIEKSKEYLPSEYSDENINILSVGRYSMAKNFDNVPEICKKVREAGYNIKWFLLGYGGCENLIVEKIKEFQMEDYVILLGKRDNPYPYIKNCDIYIQPSRYEGKCVAVREAQILNKPVIITNYATANSQLKDGYDGVIVPMDNEGCAQGIVDVIKNKELQRKLIENTKSVDYTNSSELQKIYDLIK